MNPTPEQLAVIRSLLGEVVREEERPQPPKTSDPICDVCGKREDDCRRTPESVSGHQFVAKRRLAKGLRPVRGESA